MNEKDIERINVLYRKRKEGTATPEEIEEHEKLRKEYIEAFRRNLRGTLNNITIEYEDGSKVDLGEKYGKKYAAEDAAIDAKIEAAKTAADGVEETVKEKKTESEK